MTKATVKPTGSPRHDREEHDERSFLFRSKPLCQNGRHRSFRDPKLREIMGGQKRRGDHMPRRAN